VRDDNRNGTQRRHPAISLSAQNNRQTAIIMLYNFVPMNNYMGLLMIFKQY
jgi:hypothetical protein